MKVMVEHRKIHVPANILDLMKNLFIKQPTHPQALTYTKRQPLDP